MSHATGGVDVRRLLLVTARCVAAPDESLGGVVRVVRVENPGARAQEAGIHGGVVDKRLSLLLLDLLLHHAVLMDRLVELLILLLVPLLERESILLEVRSRLMKPGTLGVPGGSSNHTTRACNGFDLRPPVREKSCGSTMGALTASTDGEGARVFMLGGCQVKSRLL